MFDNDEYQKRLKEIDYKNIDSLLHYYRWCVSASRGGWRLPLTQFEEWFPSQSSYIKSVLNKRSLIRRDIDFMLFCIGDNNEKQKLVFGDLTFSTEYDNMTEPNKRKKALRYLNQYFEMFDLIEEHGTLNTCRYHVHYVGLLKKDKTRKELKENWCSFAKVKPVKTSLGVARYLADYTTKQIPRIRRNKALVYGLKQYKQVEKDYYNANRPIDPLDNKEWMEYQEELQEMFDALPF